MKKCTTLHFAEVLDKERLHLLPYLTSVKNLKFYLAGGTALALIFWHRESIDFDFFISKHLNTSALFDQCLQIFTGLETKKIFEEENTLYITVNGVKISFMSYFYPNVWENKDCEYLSLASIQDIGAMKLAAIQDRATNKDYIDLYIIIQEIWLKKLLETFFQKYWNIVSDSFLLKSLIYFDDIKEEKLVIKDQKLTFEVVKNGLEKAVEERSDKF